MSLLQTFSLSSSGSKFARLAIVAVAALGLISADAFARAGSGSSSGSRGSRTFSAPPPTATAPKTVQPIQKSMTQPGAAQNAATAATAASQAARPSMMRNLLLGGLIGAGLATLFGAGPLSAVLGFLLQMALIAGVVYLAVMFFRSRSGAPSMATASAGRPGPAQQNAAYRQAAMSGGGSSSPALNITGDDYNSFERVLREVQLAYGRGDVDALGRLATPEMLSYFASEIEENRRKGLRNELGAPTLLQGDLSEAWREQSGEYATVAMRYSLTDVTVDQSNRVVAGSRAEPQEVTEVWTFRRNPGAGSNAWELSAIQQA